MQSGLYRRGSFSFHLRVPLAGAAAETTLFSCVIRQRWEEWRAEYMCLRERTNKGQDIRRITHFEDGRDRSPPSPANKGWKGKTQNIRRQIERGQIVIASNRLMCGSLPPGWRRRSSSSYSGMRNKETMVLYILYPHSTHISFLTASRLWDLLTPRTDLF